MSIVEHTGSAFSSAGFAGGTSPHERQPPYGLGFCEAGLLVHLLLALLQGSWAIFVIIVAVAFFYEHRWAPRFYVVFLLVNLLFAGIYLLFMMSRGATMMDGPILVLLFLILSAYSELSSACRPPSWPPNAEHAAQTRFGRLREPQGSRWTRTN
jgi:hypothetical protein